ncbi:MAG: DNA mismatch repair endonuclease MutL [Flavobacteriales bacterium]|nr:DNA mismatch repair endonuclease MutL [Flavobacteriales bacterium]
MPDIIQLLPESVANQIAAGEVVQRPASVVKELLENSIDAGATHIKLMVKDAGKTLIHISDNGTGMSETDARMSFERHATSKIKKTEDLFHIVTKGFRGEALASIAAVAQVEMRTRQLGAQLGTLLVNDGSKVKTHEACNCPEGTNILVKNLFFNVPARRYFLKSDGIEFRHIVDEFERVALTHPDIEFTFTNNGSEVFNLPKSNLRQRIVHTFGVKYNEKLVPVDESTAIVNVSGFIGKPDAAKKTRGEQFFFANNRYIRNSYLHHAVMSAFEQLLPQGHFPMYFIYLTIDPSQIDINIHPTKTEIKFQDERSIYAILHASVKRALGKFSISPSIDFDQEISIPVIPLPANAEVHPPAISINHSFNPFGTKVEREKVMEGWFDRKSAQTEGWKELMKVTRNEEVQVAAPEVETIPMPELELEVEHGQPVFQLHRAYIATQVRSGLLLIDQQRAHKRILYEKYFSQYETGNRNSQQLLFPETITLGASDFSLMKELVHEIRILGFDVEEFGGTSFQIIGVPSDAPHQNAAKLFEDFLEQFKNDSAMLKFSPRERLAWAIASSTCIKHGQVLSAKEMRDLVDRLFGCLMPYYAESGKPTLFIFGLEQIEEQLG